MNLKYNSMKMKIHSISKQRKNFNAKYKPNIVIILLKDKNLNTIATENNIQSV